MWSVLFGLKIAKSLSIPRIIVEMDSKVAVDLIHGGHASNPSIQFLLEEILSYVHMRDCLVKVIHISRTTNKCADTVIL